MPSKNAGNWMSFKEAVEKLQAKHLGNADVDWLFSYRTTTQMLLDRLSEGRARARPGRVHEYSLQFTSHSEQRDVPLEEGRVIPLLFWYYFKEVIDGPAPQLIALDDGRDFATLHDSDFHFRLTGLKDNGMLEGSARGVLLDRRTMPDLRPAHRPKKEEDADRSNVAAVLKMVSSGVSRTEAIKAVATGMHEREEANSFIAAKKRLYRKVPDKN